MKQLCGTCNHVHEAGLPCVTCDCDVFAIHPDDLAAAAKQAELEKVEYEGRETLLDSHAATYLLECLDRWEEILHQECGFGHGPVLAACHGIIDDDSRTDGKVDTYMQLARLGVLEEFWFAVTPNPGHTLAGLAQTASKHPGWFADFCQKVGVDITRGIVAWVWIAEVQVSHDASADDGHDHSKCRVGRARMVNAVDADERVYTVQRYQDDDHRVLAMDLPSVYREAYEARMRALGRDPKAEPADERVPRVVWALRKLVRVTTQLRVAEAAVSSVEEPTS
jgi:hypothetical protein